MQLSLRNEVKSHFEQIANRYDYWKEKNSFYYQEIKKLLRSKIPVETHVLDVGCGTGSLLASVEPRKGIGVDLSERMVQIATRKHPQYTYLVCDCERLSFRETFDYVIMVDLLDHLPDPWATFSGLKSVLSDQSRVVLLTANPIWDPVLKWAERRGMKMPEGPNRFVPIEEIVEILKSLGYGIQEKGYRLFIPKKIPLLSSFFNGWVPRVPVLRELCLIQYLIVQKAES